jgi:hypothetical protein
MKELIPLTDDQFLQRIEDSWKIEPASMANQFAYVISGTPIKVISTDYLPREWDEHHIYTFIIKDPKYLITNDQVGQIMDEGNHTLSLGSIFYEDNYAYITWSNKGHI